jgi:hypothetical protein
MLHWIWRDTGVGVWMRCYMADIDGLWPDFRAANPVKDGPG